MTRIPEHGVSYAEFAALSKRKNWSAEHLAESLRGKFEVTGETFENYFRRVLHCDPSADVVIPFKSVIAEFLASSCTPRTPAGK